MSLPLPMQADTNRRGQPVLLDDWIAIKLRGIEAGFKEHLNCDVLACWKIIRNNPNYSLHKLKRRIREEVVRLCAPWSWEKRMTSIIHPRFGPLPVRPEKRLPRSIGASWQFHKKRQRFAVLVNMSSCFVSTLDPKHDHKIFLPLSCVRQETIGTN